MAASCKSCVLKMDLWGLLLLLCVSLASSQTARRRFEYKYSFKGPYLSQKDGGVPFWEYFGNTIASQENVRIAPSLRSQKGSIWTKNKIDFQWWEVDFVFRINGRGRIGADGLGFWYTAARGTTGPVYGAADYWNGLGLFFDSFDNDNKHNNPYVVAVVNNGSFAYDHHNDGASQALAGCLKDFRNKPFPIRARVEYKDNHISMMMSNGMTNNQDDLEMCFRSPFVTLPPNGYFGLSAATGGLADDHDAIKFEVFSLQSGDAPLRTDDPERERLAKEYEDMQKKLDQQRKEYYEQNPDATRRPDGDDDYETDYQREFRQVINGQGHLFANMKELGRKMDEVIGRQERALSMLASVSSGGQAVQSGGVPPPAGGGGAGGILRHEVDQLLNSQREMLQATRDIRAYVTEVHQKSNTILQNTQSGSGKPASQAIGYDVHGAMNEVKDHLNIVKRDVGIAVQKLNQPANCPEVKTTGCVSTTIFVVFGAIQVVLLIGYMIYRDNKEDSRKKFY